MTTSKEDTSNTIDPDWLAAAASDDEALALTAALVAECSYPGREAAAQRIVADWLTRNGLQPELQLVAPERPNVIARVANGPGPTLLFNGHIDTVLAVDGWDCDPWQGRRDGDRFYGLGACDMKSGIAAALLATRALAARRDLWRGTLLFTSVVDEEAYSIGAHALLDAGMRADYCVVTESSFEEPALGSVGKLLARVDVTGKAAHASWPADGINAATEAARFVARLDEVSLGQHPQLAASQCVLGFHSGNEQYVITVPEKARVTINRHIVPGEDGASVLAQLEGLASDLDSPASFAFAIDPPYYPPWEIAPSQPFVQQFAAAYSAETGRAPDWGYKGFGDANLFAGAGIPTIQFGAHGGAYHQANEWTHIPSISAATRVLLRLALAMLR
jgi:acetylornithine deacetylase/succinyl-diaminopimelate desuccinylase-like protein